MKVITLTAACRRGTPEDIRRILSKDKNARLEGKHLHMACDYENTEVVRYLLGEACMDPNARSSKGWTPLHWACFMDAREVVVLLLIAKADVSITSPTAKHTPLHTASMYGNHDIVKLLLEAGANKHAKSSKGRTALELARRECHHDIVATLSF